MENENQEVIHFLFGYCIFLSHELKDKEEELEKVKKESEKENSDKQQETVDKSIMERWEIGKYLHDNLSQKLVYAKILVNLLKEKLLNNNIDANDELNEIMWIIEKSAREVRELSHDIIPMNVEKEGISQAFEYLKEQAVKQGVECRLETGDIIHKINRRKIATNLYHIAQEAIKNAMIHGEANNIKIALFEHNGQLYLHIKDDGKGISSETDVSQEGGIGITIMKHRAEEIGGTLRIRSAEKTADFNTYVTCTVPIDVLTSQ